MLTRIRQRLTFANTASLIALFVALGGSSYAALKLPKNSVGAGQIKTNAVRSAEVKNRSLLAKDFKSGQLPRGATGPQGPTGPTGPTGASGSGGGGSMAARARSTGPQPSGADNAQIPWAVSSGSWTQGAEEANFLTGQVDVTYPSTCTESFFALGRVTVNLGSVTILIGSADFSAPLANTTQTIPLGPFPSGSLASRGVSTQRELSVAVSDTCNNAGENFTFNNLRVDVGAFR